MITWKTFFSSLPTLISKKKTFSHFSQLWWWRKKLFIAVSRSHHSTCSSRSHEYWLFWAHFQPENGKWSVGMAWRISNDIIKLIEWKTFFIANIIYTLKFSNLVWVEKFHLIKNEIKFDARKSSLCCIKIEEQTKSQYLCYLFIRKEMQKKVSCCKFQLFMWVSRILWEVC